MANIQEYLIATSKSPELAVARARQLLKQTDEIKEMSVAEWLHKLNLRKYV
jgi:hypothetical protein